MRGVPHRRSLAEGKDLIHKVWSGSSDIKVTDRSLIWNSDLLETLEFDNLIGQAVVTMEGALNRQESAAPMRARISPIATTTPG